MVNVLPRYDSVDTIGDLEMVPYFGLDKAKAEAAAAATAAESSVVSVREADALGLVAIFEGGAK